jgi:class 3 adenylate cyclase/predicted ATPase
MPADAARERSDDPADDGAARAQCPACGTACRPGARFCGDCGQRLIAAPARAVSPELRPLTLMFCDIVGSSAMSAAVGPEEYAASIAAFIRATEDAVTRFGGTVTRYVGDGVLAYFGFPAAREDDPERAVHAALALQATVAGLTAPDGRPLRVRIGLATGLVLVSDIARTGDPRDLGVYGETPNLAARLQSLAEPGTVVVSASVHRALGGLFEFRDLGERRVKGWAEPVAVWQVLRPLRDVSRFEARHAGGALPMLGRDAPLARLRALWARAAGGQGQAVLVTGEPGIGKSRLAAQLLAETPRDLQLRYFTAPHQQGMALQPAILQIEHDSGIAPEDAAADKLAKLRRLLPDTTDPLDLVLIAELLLIPAEGLPPAPPMGPTQRRERLLRAMLAMLEAATRQSPRLLVFEDAHWADPLTRDLIGRAVARLPHLPLLLLVTTRPEFVPDWETAPQVERIPLEGLDAEEALALMRQVARDVPLPPDLVAAILERADGVPLFLEELTHAVVETIAQATPRAQAAAPGRAAVPVSLHASLLARLDRLGPAREVAEVGAVIGRQFDMRLLAATMRRETAALRPMLDRLVEAGIVQRGGDEFRFRHALLQDTARGLLPRERYRTLNADVADALEADFPQLSAAQPQLVAIHRTEAGQAQQAVPWWLRSAQLSMRRSAVAEALALLDKGSALLATLPDSDWRAGIALEMEVLAGHALLVTQGHAAPETRAAFARARDLCARAPSSPMVMIAMHGQWTNALLRGEMALASERAEELRAMGEARQVAEWQCTGWRAIGITSYLTGDFSRSVDALTRSFGFYDPRQHSVLASVTVHDPLISGRCYRSWGLLWLGRSAEARREACAALEAARATRHPYTVAHAIFTLAYIDLWRGDIDAARQGIEETLHLSESSGVPFFEHVARIFRGVLDGRAGDPQAGLAQIRAGIAWHDATECWAYVPGYLASEAELLALAGDTEAALRRLDEAFDGARRSGAVWDLPEFHRQRGIVLRRAGRDAEAEAALRRALDLGARLPLRHLHAALSLADLLDATGRPDAAGAVLASALGRLDEADAPVVAAARARLAARP